MQQDPNIRGDKRYFVEGKLVSLSCDLPQAELGNFSRSGVYIRHAGPLNMGDSVRFTIQIALVTFRKDISLIGKVVRRDAAGSGLSLAFESAAQEGEWKKLVQAYDQFVRTARTQDAAAKLSRPVEVMLQSSGAWVKGYLKELGETTALVSMAGVEVRDRLSMKIHHPSAAHMAPISLRILSHSAEGYSVQFEALTEGQRDALREIATEDLQEPIGSPPQTAKISLNLSPAEYRKVFETDLERRVITLEGYPSWNKDDPVSVSLRVRTRGKSFHAYLECTVVRTTREHQILRVAAWDASVEARLRRIYDACRGRRGISLSALSELSRGGWVVIALCGALLFGLWRASARFFSSAPSVSVDSGEEARFAEQAVRFKFVRHLGLESQSIALPSGEKFDAADIQSVKYDPFTGKYWLMVGKPNRDIEIDGALFSRIPQKLHPAILSLNPNPPEYMKVQEPGEPKSP